MVREWLDIPSLTFKRQDPESGLFFKFLITDNYHRKITIIRWRDNPSIIEIISETIMTEKNPQNVNPLVWQKLASKLSIEMARLGIQFLFNGEHYKFNRIRLIDQIILDDSLTDFYFRQRIIFVLRALVLVNEITKEIIGLPDS